jgi:hypothetical protein
MVADEAMLGTIGGRTCSSESGSYALTLVNDRFISRMTRSNRVTIVDGAKAHLDARKARAP